MWKWFGNDDPTKFPKRDWVKELVALMGHPPSVVEWLYNGQMVDPPVPLVYQEGRSITVSEAPDPVADIMLGRFADLECLRAVGPSEWRKVSAANPSYKLPIPQSMYTDGAVGLTLQSLDDSMTGTAEQKQTVYIVPRPEGPDLDDVAMAVKDDRVLVRVLKQGPSGYELRYLNSRTYPEAIPAKGWDIRFTMKAVIRAVEPGRMDIDYRPGGFRA